MQKRSTRLQIGLLTISLLILIFRSDAAIEGAHSGIELVLSSVIPSLLPFIFLSRMLTSALLDTNIKLLRPIGRLCGIPNGCEGFLLIGLIGGYPTGAQCVHTAYQSGGIDRSAAHRLLGFCNNAGPAFIFGILSPLFSKPFIPWILWLIQLLSALLVGILLPNHKTTHYTSASSFSDTGTSVLESSMKAMAMICGWVILFRTALSVIWSFLPDTIRIIYKALIAGLMELSNGCCMLSEIPCEGVRFIIASFLLSQGGICVAMQTRSIVATLGTGMYFPGKALQSCFAVAAAIPLQQLLFTGANQLRLQPHFHLLFPVLGLLIIAILYIKKSSSILAEAGV